MEVMAKPSEHILIFYDVIFPYLKNIISGTVPKVVFEEDTPDDIIEKFNEIKNKIGYEMMIK